MGKKLMKLPQPPDGLFSSSDFAAIGAIGYFKESGIAIPDEIALVGYSNDFSASVIEPGLTSLDQHTIRMGNLAAEQFLKQARTKPEKILSQKTLLTPRSEERRVGREGRHRWLRYMRH